MDGSHNEPEAKVKHDQGRESAPPEHVNEPPVFPALQDHDQQLLCTNPREKLPELQQPPNEADALAAEQFQSLVEKFKRLSQDDPQFAHQAAQILRFYRRSYESYVARNIDSQVVGNVNGELHTPNLQLCQQREYHKSRSAKQEEEVVNFGRPFENFGTGIGRLLRDSEGSILEPLHEAANKESDEAL
ncbi:hypothetical protein N7537_010479 [Penicillium hordei]|uniref:Uncharacterized protein n=1 Tax=Penicillium hordei TaxID=40994 RepID=A0AAD6DVF4_9EURO|nr:uncharacterized protein N7537_010479 [Penicillium hordei]KAJ5593575.1 hypothetical protein N7537_010479 [Penicillium hordei]